MNSSAKERYTSGSGKVESAEEMSAGLKKRGLLDFLQYKYEKKAAVSTDELIAMARKHYPDVNSHGWNHIEDVLNRARRMRRRELLKKELAAILYHDSSLMTGSRETHDVDSAAIAGKELKGLFRKQQLQDIVNAIAHHRASYEGQRGSRLEDLVSAADRDEPTEDITNDIMRSYRYGIEHGMTPEEAVNNTYTHMPDKYGTKGYAYRNIPKLYMDTYGDVVRKAQTAFDNVTKDQIRALAEKFASSRKETYESGSGTVESYTKDKTKDHDEIVVRLKNGRTVRISNNTKLGKRVEPSKGDAVNYYGHRINGTNVVHKTHPNKRQRGGWIEHVKAAEDIMRSLLCQRQ